MIGIIITGLEESCLESRIMRIHNVRAREPNLTKLLAEQIIHISLQVLHAILHDGADDFVWALQVKSIFN